MEEKLPDLIDETNRFFRKFNENFNLFDEKWNEMSQPGIAGSKRYITNNEEAIDIFRPLSELAVILEAVENFLEGESNKEKFGRMLYLYQHLYKSLIIEQEMLEDRSDGALQRAYEFSFKYISPKIKKEYEDTEKQIEKELKKGN